MAYTTYPAYETMFWQQQQPVICSPGQCYSLSPQDEHCTQWGIAPSPLDQKDFLFQPQMSMLSAHFLMENSPREMNLHQSNDFDRSVRYVSPTTSHHSSSFSESPTSTEHALTPNPIYQSTPFIPTTTPYPGQQTFRLPARPVPQHTIWQSQSHDTYAVLHPQSNFPAFTSAQSPHSMHELDMAQHDEGDITVIFENEVDAVHTKSPIYMPQPEELELSEDQDDSNMSSATDNDRTTTSSSHSFHSHTSDEETEEDEDPVMVDCDSDSDYDNRPYRRCASRATPRQKHARKSSNNTIISPTARIHKRTSSSSTAATSNQTSTPRPHSRRPSKSIRPKQKGPKFPGIKTNNTSTKSDRPYPCTFHRFGCTAEFPNKNEWKRHVACQHLRLGYYRCDLDGCNPDSSRTPSSTSRHGRRGAANTLTRTHSHSNNGDGTTDEIIKIYNDFNRKDLFTQHCRRMHGPTRNPALCSKPPNKRTGMLTPTKEDEIAFEVHLTDIRARCWHVRRHAPSRSSCGFCKKVFDADYYDTSSSNTSTIGQGKDTETNAEEKAWEERMEHVGRHYEKEGLERDEEEIDEDLVEWGVRTGVLRILRDGRAWLVSVDEPIGEGEGVVDGGNASGNGKGRVSGANGSGNAGDEEKERKKARRQPSRTVVRERRVSFEVEEGDTIVLGGCEGSPECVSV